MTTTPGTPDPAPHHAHTNALRPDDPALHGNGTGRPLHETDFPGLDPNTHPHLTIGTDIDLAEDEVAVRLGHIEPFTGQDGRTITPARDLVLATTIVPLCEDLDLTFATGLAVEYHEGTRNVRRIFEFNGHSLDGWFQEYTPEGHLVLEGVYDPYLVGWPILYWRWDPDGRLREHGIGPGRGQRVLTWDEHGDLTGHYHLNLDEPFWVWWWDVRPAGETDPRHHARTPYERRRSNFSAPASIALNWTWASTVDERTTVLDPDTCTTSPDGILLEADGDCAFGLIRTHHPDGTLHTATEYADGLPDAWRIWDQHATLREETTHRTGLRRTWDADGNLTHEHLRRSTFDVNTCIITTHPFLDLHWDTHGNLTTHHLHHLDGTTIPTRPRWTPPYTPRPHLPTFTGEHGTQPRRHHTPPTLHTTDHTTPTTTPLDDKHDIITYLTHATELITIAHTTPDPHGGDPIPAGHTILTDGTHLWRKELPTLLHRHNTHIPTPLLAHARTHGYTPPTPTTHTLNTLADITTHHLTHPHHTPHTTTPTTTTEPHP